MTGAEFAYRRTLAKLTQQSLATIMQVSVETLRRWERQAEVPHLADLALRWITKDDHEQPTTPAISARVSAPVAIEPTAEERFHLRLALSSPDNLMPTALEELKTKFPDYFADKS